MYVLDLAYFVDYVVTDATCNKEVLNRAESVNLPVVSAEWIVQCLITGRLLKHDASPKFVWNYYSKDEN